MIAAEARPVLEVRGLGSATASAGPCPRFWLARNTLTSVLGVANTIPCGQGALGYPGEVLVDWFRALRGAATQRPTRFPRSTTAALPSRIIRSLPTP